MDSVQSKNGVSYSINSFSYFFYFLFSIALHAAVIMYVSTTWDSDHNSVVRLILFLIN